MYTLKIYVKSDTGEAHKTGGFIRDAKTGRKIPKDPAALIGTTAEHHFAVAPGTYYYEFSSFEKTGTLSIVVSRTDTDPATMIPVDPASHDITKDGQHARTAHFTIP